MKRFGKKGKLAPRFVGPFRVLERIGKMAYRLELPDQLRCVHNVFQVLMLRKHIRDEDLPLVVDFRGYASSLCIDFQRELGGSLAVDRVFIQQQLPSEYWYDTF